MWASRLPEKTINEFCVKSMEEVRVAYDEYHTEDDCDCCLKKVGVKNLYKLPFLYMDKNDHFHPNRERGYRLYYVCKKCFLKIKKSYYGGDKKWG